MKKIKLLDNITLEMISFLVEKGLEFIVEDGKVFMIKE